MPSISMKELLEAGVHFGHQTKRWNPKMKEYIFGERNGIYIIDLQKTLKLFKDAMRYVGEMAAQGKTVLFVGTKRQAQEAIAEEATRCQQYYVNQRWLGGLLTNMATVQKSIKRLEGTGRHGRRGQLGRPRQEGSRPPGAGAQAPEPESGGHQGHERPAGHAVRDRFEQGSDRGGGSAQAGHPGGGRCRHQLRSGQSGLRDSRQRRRAARHPPVHHQDLRRGGGRPATGDRAGLRAGEDHQRRSPARRRCRITRSTSIRSTPSSSCRKACRTKICRPSLPRKGPAAEAARRTAPKRVRIAVPASCTAGLSARYARVRSSAVARASAEELWRSVHS